MKYQELVQNVNNGIYDCDKEQFLSDLSSVQGIGANYMQGLASLIIQRNMKSKPKNIIDLELSTKKKRSLIR